MEGYKRIYSQVGGEYFISCSFPSYLRACCRLREAVNVPRLLPWQQRERNAKKLWIVIPHAITINISSCLSFTGGIVVLLDQLELRGSLEGRSLPRVALMSHGCFSLVPGSTVPVGFEEPFRCDRLPLSNQL